MGRHRPVIHDVSGGIRRGLSKRKANSYRYNRTERFDLCIMSW